MGQTSGTQKYLIRTLPLKEDELKIHLQTYHLEEFTSQPSGTSWILSGNIFPEQLDALMSLPFIQCAMLAEKPGPKHQYFVQTEFAFREMLQTRLQEMGLIAEDMTRVEGLWGFMGHFREDEIASLLNSPYITSVYRTRVFKTAFPQRPKEEHAPGKPPGHPPQN